VRNPGVGRDQPTDQTVPNELQRRACASVLPEPKKHAADPANAWQCLQAEAIFFFFYFFFCIFFFYNNYFFYFFLFFVSAHVSSANFKDAVKQPEREGARWRRPMKYPSQADAAKLAADGTERGCHPCCGNEIIHTFAPEKAATLATKFSAMHQGWPQIATSANRKNNTGSNVLLIPR